jgi:protein SCO1
MKFVVLSALVLSGCAWTPSKLPSYGVTSDFQLTSQDGQPFDSKTLRGKIWVADFIFTTCPGVCPRMTRQMRQVEEATHKMPEVRLVSFTVDPTHDTPTVLAAYAKEQHVATEHWFFLTGPQATLHHLARDVFKVGNVDGSLQHSTRFMLVDQKSRIRGYYDTSEADSIHHLIWDIHALGKERD